MPMHVERARAIMARDGLDGLVAATLENFFYLSGIWNLGQELFPHDTQAYVVATREQPDAGLLAVSVGEADLTLEAYPTLKGAITYGTFFRELPPGVDLDRDERKVYDITYNQQPKADPFEALCAAIEESGLAHGTIGVDERGPNRDLLDQLRARFPQLEVRPASQTFRQIRMVKTPEEHERLIAALRATEHALRTTVAAAREGITERELAHVFEQAIVDKQARPGFPLAAWQVLFVTGNVLGFYRDGLGAWLQRFRRIRVAGVALGVAVTLALISMAWGAETGTQFGFFDLDPNVLNETFFKVPLRPWRLVAFLSVAIVFYTCATYLWVPLRRALGWLMLPLGQAALYSYIVHFFLILLVYNLVPWFSTLPWEPSEAVFTPLLQSAVVFLLWILVRKRFLWGIIPN
jgi:hypothetical protein